MTKTARTASTAPNSSMTLQPSLSLPKALLPRILMEDTHLVVLTKPAGLLSQGEQKGDPNLVDWLREYFGRHYVGLIHRLDRNTSGVMVVAKRTKSARRLTDALQKGELKRIYLGWVVGTLSKEQHWSHLLTKDSRTNRVSVVSQKNGESPHKAARLKARPIQKGHWQGQAVTLVEFQLETGRSHQIRVQAAHEGFPLLGDIKYTQPRSALDRNPSFLKFSRVALHSFQLRFPHPMSGETLTFEDPLPADLQFPEESHR
jgi:23S rRNA pseudouridine1911/1915/1917 synthase